VQRDPGGVSCSRDDRDGQHRTTLLDGSADNEPDAGQGQHSPARRPRTPEMAYEREPPLSEAELLEVEEYLLECCYVAPTNIGLLWGTYIVTSAGFSWLEGGFPEPTDRLRELAKSLGEEAAFELAVRTELEEERHRKEELESELKQMRQNLPGAQEKAAVESERAESQLAGDTFQTVSERPPWWRRMI
jgi:hypothetical protein